LAVDEYHSHDCSCESDALCRRNADFFVATVVGIDDKTVNWAVEEENSGTITDSGLYTAPKIEGVYHIIATSRARPETKAVATVTVLAYCDPLPPAFRR
jgi:chitinase